MKEMPNMEEEPDFSIDEEDIKQAFKEFVKGMNEGERNRFLRIYEKF